MFDIKLYINALKRIKNDNLLTWAEVAESLDISPNVMSKIISPNFDGNLRINTMKKIKKYVDDNGGL